MELLHRGGYRVTPQRLMILDAVCEGGGHTTAEAIYRRVRAKSPRINRATVYRTLDFLHEQRLVTAADLGGGRLVYEIANETPHHHLVCRCCGKVEVLSDEVLQGMFEAISQRYAFTVDEDHLVMFGVCEGCQANLSPLAPLP
jgi:Fur family ferric uptake transcriptional regulator